MSNHEEKVNRIAKQLKERKSTEPLSLMKKSVSHEVPKPNNKKYSDEKLDVRDMNEIIEIDPIKKICIAEPGVTFVDLVDATMKHNLVPIVVPELKTITIGGAVAGCSIESMSYKHGGFHDSCLEYEIITAKGEVIVCKPDSLLFQMMHGTFGTLGIISRLKFKLISAKPFVKVTYEKYGSLKDYKSAIYEHYKKKDIDFMDGIIHSPTEFVLSIGTFVDEAPYAHNYDWMRVYYKSTATRSEDYLKTPDYFFRYNKGVTNVNPKSFLGRLFFGWFTNSTRALKFANKFHKLLSHKMIPVTVDLFIPYQKIDKFFDWYDKEVNHYPLWCVPYRAPHIYEWISDDFKRNLKSDFFFDIAIYGMRRDDGKNYYKIIEDGLKKVGAIKTLISTNYYTEDEFWKIWNKSNYDKIKKKTDPDNIFRNLYNKTCRASRGLD